MSLSFTQFTIADKTDLTQAGIVLSGHLFDLGFYTRNTIVAVDYDETINAFADSEDLGLPPNLLIAKEQDVFKQQNGFALNFINPELELTLTARLINHHESSICILEMSDKNFYTLFQSQNIHILIGILLTSAKSIQAIAGFGAMEVEWEPYTKNEATQFLIDGPPEYEGKQPPVGIIKTTHLKSDPALLKGLSTYFNCRVEEEYTILLRKGASELFSSL
jgi:hypothetical protein